MASDNFRHAALYDLHAELGLTYRELGELSGVTSSRVMQMVQKEGRRRRFVRERRRSRIERAFNVLIALRTQVEAADGLEAFIAARYRPPTLKEYMDLARRGRR